MENTAYSEVKRVLLGCALGDSLGLPYEGLSSKKASRLAGESLKHRLFFGKGMLSDDTEHSIFVIDAFNRSSGIDKFARRMKKSLRFWLLTCPPGIGFGTLKSLLKMWTFFLKPSVKSAGNGPLMRTAVLAALLKDQPSQLEVYVKVNTYLTHADERAFETSLVLALLVQKNLSEGGLSVTDLEESSANLKNAEFKEAVQTLISAFKEGKTPDEYLAGIGLEKGITGYCIHTFCGAVYANLYFGTDIKQIIHWSIKAGGDTDSVAAVAAALAAANPECTLPEDLIAGIKDKPFSVKFMKKICRKEAGLCCFTPKMILRNLFFVPLILVLAVVRTFR